MQAPGFQATTQITSRVLTRGKLEFFNFEFFYDDAKIMPVAPFDVQSHPSYRIVAPSGELLAQGVAVAGGQPGLWRVGWVVPPDADLGTVNHRYLLQTVMVDTEMRQFEVSFEFDVIEDKVPPQDPECSQYLTFGGESIRVRFVNTVQPQQLSVRITPKDSNATIHSAVLTLPAAAPPLLPNALGEVIDKTCYTYYTDTPALAAGSYSVIWKVRDFTESPTEFEHQIIQSVPPKIMHLVSAVRMIVDKLQKKLGIVYAYCNEDIVGCIQNGTNLVNSYAPPSNYDFTNFPDAIESFIILAASWWCLTSQRILYAETNLDFSGQTVTLGYNPGADLDGIIANLKATLDERVPATKKSLFRQGSAVGALSTRPYRYRTGQVFPISAGTGADVLRQLTLLGILG